MGKYGGVRYRPRNYAMNMTGYGGRAGLAYLARTGLARAARLNAGRSYTGTATQRKTQTSGIGVTVQHDSRRIYKKKNMPRRKKKIWKKFVKRVHAVSEKDLGSRTVLFNHSVTLTNNQSAQQGVLTTSLYSCQSNDAWSADLNQISGLENQTNPTAAAGQTIDKSSKFLFQSGVLDLTIRNVSFLQGTTTLEPTATLELDVYEITASKDFQQTGSAWTSLSTALAEGSNNTNTIGGAGNNINIASRGATPFDIPLGLSRFGIKVWKKTKYFVPNGSTVTYQFRDPKRHVVTLRDMSVEGGINMPKMTKFCFIIFKAVPGVVVGGSPNNVNESIQVGITRKYMYKIEGVNEDRARYIYGSASGVNPN